MILYKKGNLTVRQNIDSSLFIEYIDYCNTITAFALIKKYTEHENLMLFDHDGDDFILNIRTGLNDFFNKYPELLV